VSKPDAKQWLSAQIDAGRSDRDIAGAFTQMFGRPITVDLVRQYRNTDHVSVRRSTQDRQEAVERIRDGLGSDDEIMRDVLQGLLLELEDPDLSVKNRVEVSREIRQNLLSRQQMAKMVDSNTGAVFVFVQNGQVAGHSLPEGVNAEDIIDADFETDQD